MHISRLFVYPIKSCAGIEVDQLEFDALGPKGDRRYMLVDAADDASDNTDKNNVSARRFLTQRQLPKMAFIQPQWLEGLDEGVNDGLAPALKLSAPEMNDFILSESLLAQESGDSFAVEIWGSEFSAQDCGDSVAAWFSHYLQRDCRLVRITEQSQRQVSLKRAKPGRFTGFADGYPLLVINQASLDFLSEQLGRALEAERFRANIVVADANDAGLNAFDELRWTQLKPLSGHGRLAAVKPCERCVIPTRDLQTQQRDADVMAVLKQHCRIDGKIIFGQNLIEEYISNLQVGDQLTSE